MLEFQEFSCTTLEILIDKNFNKTIEFFLILYYPNNSTNLKKSIERGTKYDKN